MPNKFSKYRGLDTFRVISIILVCLFCSQAWSKDLKGLWGKGNTQSSTSLTNVQCPSPLLVVSGDIFTPDYIKNNVPQSARNDAIKAYDSTTRIIRKRTNVIVNMADLYQRTGDDSIAACAQSLIIALSESEGLKGRMRGTYAYYFRTWMLNANAVAWLKIKNASTVNENDPRVMAWIRMLAIDTRDYFSARELRSPINNLNYWGGTAVMSSAIVLQDPILFNWAEQVFKKAIAAIQADGSLASELARKERALHYHIFALMPILMMLEYTEENGIILDSVSRDALERLVKLTFSGIRSSSSFQSQFNLPKQRLDKTMSLIWANPLLERFGMSGYRDLSRKFSDRNPIYLGGKFVEK